MRLTRRRLSTAGSRRLIWTGIIWVFAGALVAYGVGYITEGIITVNNPSYAAFIKLPGRFKTHGCIQIGIAIVLLIGLVPQLAHRPANTNYLRVVIVFPFAIYCGITAMGFALAPVAGGTKNPGWISWTAFCAVGLLLGLVPPPPADSQDGAARGEPPA